MSSACSGSESALLGIGDKALLRLIPTSGCRALEGRLT